MISSAIVRVSASTSNLGAGFDCVGVAVDRWLTVSATHDDAADFDLPRIQRHGTLTGITISPEHDLIWRGIRAACQATGREPPHGIVIEASSEIPVGCGLGSSAAAVVAGAVLATELLDLRLDRHAIAAVCTAIEGHPDNVAPAVFGGAVLAVVAQSSAGRVSLVASPLDVHESLTLVFAIPDFTLETKASRAALPATLPHAVAVAAAARGAALVRGLASGDGALLAIALDDVLHVPYRRALVRGYDAVVAAAVHAGAFGATLSGAGSGIVAIAPVATSNQVASTMAAAWRGYDVAAFTFQNARAVPGYKIQALDSRPVPRSTGVETTSSLE